MNVESHIGQYKILRTLGAGGMGTVYLGEHLLLGRRAAIKTLLPTLSSHREIVDRFFNEARAISAISDPGVVQIFDFGYHVDGTAYIVMEYLEGESLSARLDRLAKLPLADALRITRQIAASLGAAHARGIIHRDLKPGNVFMIRDSEAQGGERTKILDFGIAKLVSRPTDLVAIASATDDRGSAATRNIGASNPRGTQTGTMLGTPVYMSPEQCRGDGKIDHRSDIYSVGCALFHMLTGVPPFDCDSVGEFIASHLKEQPPRPSDLARELPPEVDELVLRCLEKNPADRFQTMGELAAACEDLAADLSDPGRLPQPTDAMSKTPLGDGFKSAYDVNRGDKVRTVDISGPAKSWFVDSLSSVPASDLEHEDDHEWLPPERGLSPFQRIMMVLVLFVGLLGGLVVTGYVMDDDSVTAELIDLPATLDASEPAVATARESVPPEPVAAEFPDEMLDPEIETTPAAAPAATPKPQRPHPARTQPRPRPRREVPATTPVEEPQTEDLYDTR